MAPSILPEELPIPQGPMEFAPGAVDVIDLGTLQRMASVDVGQQVGGIDCWKVEAVGK